MITHPSVAKRLDSVTLGASRGLFGDIAVEKSLNLKPRLAWVSRQRVCTYQTSEGGFTLAAKPQNTGGGDESRSVGVCLVDPLKNSESAGRFALEVT